PSRRAARIDERASRPRIVGTVDEQDIAHFSARQRLEVLRPGLGDRGRLPQRLQAVIHPVFLVEHIEKDRLVWIGVVSLKEPDLGAYLIIPFVVGELARRTGKASP